MANTRSGWVQAIVALLVGLPLAVFLWQRDFDRMDLNSAVAAHVRLGDEAMRNGRYLEAVSAYSRARELKPTAPALQIDQFRARAYLAAEQPARIGNDGVEQLKYDFDFLRRTDCGDVSRTAVYLTALGNVAARQGQNPLAERDFNEALKTDPKCALAHTALGLHVLATGTAKDSIDKAAKELEAALQEKKDDVPALIGMAQIDLAKGKDQDAIDRLVASFKVRDDAGARVMLGNAYLGLKRTEQAIDAFRAALRLEPRNIQAMRSLGQALLTANKPAEAEEVLRQAIAISNDEESAVALGFALARQKKAQPALAAFGTALKQDGTDPAALFGAGTVLEGLGNTRGAAALYQKLASLQAPPGVSTKSLEQLQNEAKQRLQALASAAPAPSVAPPPKASPRARLRRHRGR